MNKHCNKKQCPLLSICLVPIAGGGYTIVDSEDYADAVRYKWSKSTTGYIRRHNKAKTRAKRGSGRQKHKKIYLHRSLMNAPKGTVVDHVNRCKLDNRKSNLRICTQKDNCRNSSVRVSGKRKSKYKGVSYENGINKWRAYINYEGKRMHLGVFTDEIVAASAYNKKATELYGQYACLNAV
jgi:hypothetical protein